MFGKRAETGGPALKAPPTKPQAEAPKPEAAITPTQVNKSSSSRNEPSEEYYETKATIFNALFETICLLYTSPSPRDLSTSRMPSSA